MESEDRTRPVRELLLSSGALRIKPSERLRHEMEQYQAGRSSSGGRYDHTRDAFAYSLRVGMSERADKRRARLFTILRLLLAVLAIDLAVIVANFIGFTRGFRPWNAIVGWTAFAVCVALLLRIVYLARMMRDA